jgi:23S rRNA (adenine1618-N6)-methyltransferase
MTSLKTQLHPRNRHRGPYEFAKLIKVCPDLTQYIAVNKYGLETIDFSDPMAVKTLNKAILKLTYDVIWDIPDSFLCPPIPGRADYIHYIADILNLAKGKALRVLDIGIGANCIYPLIGHKEYGWSFVGTDIDPVALSVAKEIVALNKLEKGIELRWQKNPAHIFEGVLKEGEVFDISMCNPPFHASQRAALQGTQRKWKNLKLKTKTLNFGGQGHELWCPGGEVAFITQMIEESVSVKCFWFTTLVSQKSSLPHLYNKLKLVKATHVKTINMGQGHKKSRLIAWTFTQSNV